MRNPPTVLCVTRAFPPVVGGMEKLSFEFTRALARKTPVLLVANRYGKKALPFFLPWATWRLRQLASQADIIHLGDPLLTVLLPFIPTPRKPVAVTVHGLDIRYPSSLYQALLRRFLPRVNLVICISRFVEREVRERFPSLPTVVITPGLRESFTLPGATRADLEGVLGLRLGTDPLLLSVARLVPRKGLAWFVQHVLQDLPKAQLLAIGEGPERQRIMELAERAGVASRVICAGRLNQKTLKLAYSVADLFIMPNITIPGDAEGFGLVALEAASAGLPTVAADLEGITDSVVAGETGVLVGPGDARAWINAITELLNSPSRRQSLAASARRVVQERFSQARLAEQSMQVFADLASKNTDRHSPD